MPDARPSSWDRRDSRGTLRSRVINGARDTGRASIVSETPLRGVPRESRRSQGVPEHLSWTSTRGFPEHFSWTSTRIDTSALNVEKRMQTVDSLRQWENEPSRSGMIRARRYTPDNDQDRDVEQSLREKRVTAIRLRVSADEDGELRLRGLPIRKGEHAEVIVLTDGLDEASADEVTLALLQHDPAWAWLHDSAEDVYTEDDVRPTSRRLTVPARGDIVLARFPFTDGSGTKLRRSSSWLKYPVSMMTISCCSSPHSGRSGSQVFGPPPRWADDRLGSTLRDLAPGDGDADGDDLAAGALLAGGVERTGHVGAAPGDLGDPSSERQLGWERGRT